MSLTEHADPELTAIPFKSACKTRVSPSIFLQQILTCPGILCKNFSCGIFSFTLLKLGPVNNRSGTSETLIPFTLSDDLKISKGIQKEKQEKINLSNDEALKKIEQLLKWGDLAGALELSIKTGQREKYEELMRKISS